MAGTICPTNCGAPVVINNYADACAPLKRGSGGSFLLFYRCDITLTDPTLPADWTTAAQAGEAFVTPCGVWTMTAPTQDIIEVSGCGDKYNQNSVFNIDFRTFEFHATGDDVVFFQNLENNQTLWRVIPVTCQDYYFLSDEGFDVAKNGTAYVDQQMGVSFTMSQTPYQDRPGNAQTAASWVFQLEVNKVGVYADFPLTGVLAAVQNA